MKVSALKQAVVTALSEDPATQALLGGDQWDSRVYWFYSPAVIVDPAHPAYIVYQLLALPMETGATTTPVLRFTAWGRNVQVVEDVRDCICALFSRQQLTLADAMVVYGTVVQETDAYDDAANLAGRIVEAQFGALDIMVP